MRLIERRTLCGREPGLHRPLDHLGERAWRPVNGTAVVGQHRAVDIRVKLNAAFGSSFVIVQRPQVVGQRQLSALSQRIGHRATQSAYRSRQVLVFFQLFRAQVVERENVRVVGQPLTAQAVCESGDNWRNLTVQLRRRDLALPGRPRAITKRKVHPVGLGPHMNRTESELIRAEPLT